MRTFWLWNKVKIDSFTYSRQAIERATAEGRFDMAHNRVAALRYLVLHLIDYLYTIVYSFDEEANLSNIKQVREYMKRTFKLLTHYLSLSMYMVKDFSQQVIDEVSVKG